MSSLAINIPEKDKEILSTFCERAKQLEQKPVFYSNQQFSLVMDRIQENKFEVSDTGPSEEELISIITLLRPFYLQKDEISFNRVCNKVSKHLRLEGKKPEILERVADLKSQFEKASKELAFPIMFSEKKVTATEAIDLWFNAHFFHTDIEKRKKLDQLMSTPDGPFIQFSFKGAILELSKLVISMGSLIQKELLSRS